MQAFQAEFLLTATDNMVQKSALVALGIASVAAGIYWSNKRSKATTHHVDHVAADIKFVSVCVCMHVCILDLFVYTCIHTDMYSCIHKAAYIHTYVHTCVDLTQNLHPIIASTFIHIHKNIHTCMHAHAHFHAQIKTQNQPSRHDTH